MDVWPITQNIDVTKNFIATHEISVNFTDDTILKGSRTFSAKIERVTSNVPVDYRGQSHACFTIVDDESES